MGGLPCLIQILDWRSGFAPGVRGKEEEQISGIFAVDLQLVILWLPLWNMIVEDDRRSFKVLNSSGILVKARGFY